MGNLSKTRTTSFSGYRMEALAPHGPSQVLNLLGKYCGKVSDTTIARLASSSPSVQEFAATVQEEYVGTSGFMMFSQINHSGWISAYGIKRQVVRVILGNPFIAVTMMKIDLRAGLFAPVEVLLIGSEDGATTTIVYVKPSSLIALTGDPELHRAATRLDEKLSRLIDALCFQQKISHAGA